MSTILTNIKVSILFLAPSASRHMASVITCFQLMRFSCCVNILATSVTPLACCSSIEMRSDTLFSYCCLGAGNIISTLTNKHNGTVFFLLYKGKSIGHLDRGTLRRKYVELNFTPKQQQQHCT